MGRGRPPFAAIGLAHDIGANRPPCVILVVLAFLGLDFTPARTLDSVFSMACWSTTQKASVRKHLGYTSLKLPAARTKHAHGECEDRHFLAFQ